MAQPAMKMLHYKVNAEAITKQQMQQKMFLTIFFEIRNPSWRKRETETTHKHVLVSIMPLYPQYTKYSALGQLNFKYCTFTSRNTTRLL
jgi:hypothetical protein